MTSPSAPQWPLAPALRLAALAMILSVLALMTTGPLSLLLWAGAAVSIVLAGVKLGKNWKRVR